MEAPLEARREEHDGVVVRVEFVTDPRTDKSHRVVIADIGCAGLSIRIFPGHYFIALGRQDMELGLPGFDDRYIVKTTAPQFARFWLDEAVQLAILSTYRPTAAEPFAIEIDAGVVRMTTGARRRSEPVLGEDDAIAAAVVLAQRERREIDRWRAIAAKLSGTLHGERWTWDESLAIAIPAGGARTRASRIDFPSTVPWTDEVTPRTRIAIPRGATPFWSYTPQLGDLEPADARLAIAAHVDWVHADDQAIWLGWDRIVTDVARLDAALVLGARLWEWVERRGPSDGARDDVVLTANIGCPGLELVAKPGAPRAVRDEVLGHAGFDDRFVVTTREPALARFWLGEAELAAMLATYDPMTVTPFTFEIRDGRIQLRSRIRSDGSLPRRDEAMRCATVIAAREQRELAEWRARAAALGGELTGGRWTWSDLAIVVGAETRIPIRIDFPLQLTWSARVMPQVRITAGRQAHGDDVLAVAAATLPPTERPRLPPDHVRVAVGPLVGGRTRDAPELPAIDDRVAAAGLDWLVIDGLDVVAGWTTFQRSTAALAAGISAVRALAELFTTAVADGPYR